MSSVEKEDLRRELEVAKAELSYAYSAWDGSKSIMAKADKAEEKVARLLRRLAA
jgi:hypothetical protein